MCLKMSVQGKRRTWVYQLNGSALAVVKLSEWGVSTWYYLVIKDMTVILNFVNILYSEII